MQRIQCNNQVVLAAHRADSVNLSPFLRVRPVAVGVSGLFIETHEDPDNAPSDYPNMVPLDQLEPLLCQLSAIAQAAHG